MEKFNRKAFIDVTRQYLASKLDADVTAERYLEVDERTVRYYHLQGVLDKPVMSGREAIYNVQYVKQFVAIRLLQLRGAELALIRHKLKDIDSVLQQASVIGITAQDIENFVKQNVESEEQEADAAAAPQQIVEEKVMFVRKHITTPDGKIHIKVTDQNEYQSIEDNLKTGAAFVFLNGLDEETSKKIHRLIHGQKSKKVAIAKDLVIPVDEEGFELPGCTAEGSSVLRDMALVVSDKDVYKEGNDVAQIFIFDPSAAGVTRKVSISLDGAVLDSVEVKLDSNGCGITRYATAAAGSYSIKLDESEASCSFAAARYSLAPFVTTLANIRKDEKNIFTTIEAMSFGQPYLGKAVIDILSNGVSVEKQEVEFHEGMVTVQFKPQGEAAMSLRVTSKEDPDLISAVPLPGTRQSEREDTVISSLGKKRTISLLATQDSKQERGLFIGEGSMTNTPVMLNEVISKKIELSFAADVEQLTIMVREPVLGTTQIYEIGSVKKGKGHKIDFASSLASIHIGGLVDGKPWEGHAVVVQPSKMSVSLDAPKRREPGELLEVKIKTKKKASVLLRIADKRMRVQDSAKTATASMLKRWITAAVGRFTVGDVITEPNDGRCHCPSCTAGRLQNRGQRGRGIMRGAGGGQAIMFAAAAPAAFAMNMADVDEGGLENFQVGAAAGFMDDTQQKQLLMKVGDDDTKGPRAMNPKRMVELQGLTAKGLKGAQGPRGFSGFSGFSGSSGYSGSAARFVNRASDSFNETKTSGTSGTAVATETETAIAREMEVDLIYSGLLEVDKEMVVKIQLPDTIGSYDITAFAVSNGDWAEAETSLTVEKETYIEPMLPQFAHPEDKVVAVAIGVRGPKSKKYRITVDGSEEKAGAKTIVQEGGNVRCSWSAVPGVHEIVMLDENDNELDKVVRVIEEPGEETVLGQELRILKAGEQYDINADDGALSLKVLPGIQSELKVAVNVCTNFEHCCCEQTSSGVAAACVAAMVGDDNACKEQAYQSIIKGERRLKAMHQPGKGFASYPGREIVQEWSSAAARRVGNLGVLLEAAKLPSDARAAVESMIKMGQDVLSIKNVDHYNEHGREGADNSQGDMESIYYGRKTRAVTSGDVDKALQTLNDKNGGYWNYKPKSEAAFMTAVLFKNNQLDLGVKAANAVAKAMGGTLGGAFHGSYEALAYMHMVHEMQKAGIVPGLDTKIVADGKEMTIEKAIELKSVSKVKASAKGACAIRITRLSKIRFDELNAGVQLSLDVKDKHGTAKAFKAGSQVTLTVKLTGGYQMGDVLCVALPDCLNRIIGGTKAKKFQLDFAGKNEMSVELVAGRPTTNPQRWAAVVRNMYDGARLGSVGLLSAQVK